MGNQISLWAWPEGAEPPEEPLIHWTDDTIPGGFVALSSVVWTNMIEAATDLNVTFDDVSITGVTPFWFCAPAGDLSGDVDGSGQVDFTDFLMLSSNYGQSVATYQEGDVDCNGFVDFADFLQVSANFGATENSNMEAVPEPDGWAIGSGCLGAFPNGSIASAERQAREHSLSCGNGSWARAIELTTTFGQHGPRFLTNSAT